MLANGPLKYSPTRQHDICSRPFEDFSDDDTPPVKSQVRISHIRDLVVDMRFVTHNSRSEDEIAKAEQEGYHCAKGELRLSSRHHLT